MPPSVSTHHQRGQKLYQKGDFKAAIEAFGEALKQKDADVIGILDNRAATYCKLEQWDSARRDAKNMIKTANQDERGYLRCAKVLLLDGKPEKALEIYAYGLKTLGSKHPRREMLDQLHKKLQDRMLLNRKDPFTLLPLEMAMLVIQHFSFKQIVGIMRVCKGWQRFFGSLSHIWMNLDFSGARGNVSFNAVRSYIRRSRGLLTHATIKSLPVPQIQRSLEFLSRCPHLQHLELWVPYDQKEFFEKFKRCKKIKSLLFSADRTIPLDSVSRLLNELPKLEKLTIWSCGRPALAAVPIGSWPSSLPNLKSITLATQQAAPDIRVLPLRIPHLLSNQEPHPYQNLEELRLDWDPPVYSAISFPFSFVDDLESQEPDLELPPKLRRLDLRGIIPSPLLFSSLPENLEYLRFSGGNSRPIPIEDTEKKFPRLHTIILSDTSWVTQPALEVFLFDLQPPIRTLYLDKCFNLTWHGFISIIEQQGRNPELAKLEELGITHWRDLDDTYASALRQSFTRLKILDLSSTGITGCTIREFADSRASGSDKGAKIDRLVVRGCEGVSSDAVAYGRANGLDVVA
ncbi:hypothetical protein N7493_002898 [Penicillium malachiteum]|uniref:F-box domain-containing protein n=1 Tax=Penicillium malachiteum TaxID=1324776 RepID=A0AAD6MZ74_9EURO|nr:hypothetical protein N7493_002898 [Penicillium malachiteum]